MRLTPLLMLTFLLPAFAAQAGTKVADACGRLTARNADLTRNCVNHAELFEVDSAFIRAVVEFHPSVEVRMKALKSGANVEILNLCKGLGWSTDHTLSCLRSYPTSELVRECKKIGGREEDQLRCVREGKETSQVTACVALSPRPKDRVRCLEMNIPALAVFNCNNLHAKVSDRFACLQKEIMAREEEYRRDQAAMKARMATIAKDPAHGEPSLVPPSAKKNRSPATVPKK